MLELDWQFVKLLRRVQQIQAAENYHMTMIIEVVKVTKSYLVVGLNGYFIGLTN